MRSPCCYAALIAVARAAAAPWAAEIGLQHTNPSQSLCVGRACAPPEVVRSAAAARAAAEMHAGRAARFAVRAAPSAVRGAVAPAARGAAVPAVRGGAPSAVRGVVAPAAPTWTARRLPADGDADDADAGGGDADGDADEKRKRVPAWLVSVIWVAAGLLVLLAGAVTARASYLFGQLDAANPRPRGRRVTEMLSPLYYDDDDDAKKKQSATPRPRRKFFSTPQYAGSLSDAESQIAGDGEVVVVVDDDDL